MHVMKLKKTRLRAGGAGAVYIYPYNLKKMAQRNAIIGLGKRWNKPMELVSFQCLRYALVIYYCL